jgi:type I restriction enzyme M protein
MKDSLDAAKIANQDRKLRDAAGEAFYNTSKFMLRDLRNRAGQQKLKADFEAYLDGFSPNVQEILDNFEFRNQIPRLSKADALGTLIEKLLSSDVNLGPKPVLAGDGSIKQPGLDNHAMGTIFEELVRRFNEENNEEAGEHWTPRDAVKLMANLIFLPVADRIESGTYLLYDGACGTGGMLTVAEETLQQLAAAHGKQVATHLYGQEINAETYAICKADLLLKGEGRGGRQHRRRTRVVDARQRRVPSPRVRLHALQSAVRQELEERPRTDGRQGRDEGPAVHHRARRRSRVLARHPLQRRPDAVPGQHAQQDEARDALGSRIAEVHNGSSLFTGDAGQGESNIRRWIIENDWLEAIVALPLNMFYNTGIATYVWVLTNRKPEHRAARCSSSTPPAGSSRCARTWARRTASCRRDIAHLRDLPRVQGDEQSKIFPNAAFGYWKVTVERPLAPGYEISFTRYFYKPQPLRSLEEIRADILALEKETEGLLKEIVGTGAA